MSSEDLIKWANEQNWEEVIGTENGKKAMQKAKAQIEGEEEEDDADRIKLVIVGDGAVGKTCLLITFATGHFPEEYVPTVFENYCAKMKINDKPVLLHLWDTAGQEDYDRLRPLSYPDSNIVLLCFSTTSKNSFESVSEKWHKEVKHYLPDVPIILVGTKVDLRDSKQQDPNAETTEYVTTKEGEDLANEIEAAKYMEVSAKDGGAPLQEVFLECVKIVLSNLLEDEPEELPEKEFNISSNKKKEGGSSSSSSGGGSRRGCVIL
mmetsp:Transcript_11261/g.17036  ORF Transcript_11261/g.17036 Transcript_11261/m.17036 type:complete len:264 (-) Transcript_11261:250-1041(-)|eukprot:CAMPEP_0201519028 /NCGR_PEP_ID=MMETSP0161_2-20130828/9690_1 /ASSEMBLY_ACC=CAM_ASM_000251 /TAXON_ID=180227 /ORGANISM="Neoparamoeba aestuarina, Strain SoJaBio B1-5/56/2" /LENGTH=263 /DNA_ID=CAMNT_0047916949 /DNA_START=163 /DNA_END=954 /DNA_ORIENTATION=+